MRRLMCTTAPHCGQCGVLIHLLHFLWLEIIIIIMWKNKETTLQTSNEGHVNFDHFFHPQKTYFNKRVTGWQNRLRWHWSVMSCVYLSLHHCWPLCPQHFDSLEDVHCPFITHPLQDNTQSDENTCPSHSSTAETHREWASILIVSVL